MNWRHLSLVLWLVGTAVSMGQIDDPPVRSGLYKGTFTISSPDYGATKAPVKNTAKVVARVTTGSFNSIKAVIRAEPRLTVLNSVPTFVLVFDGKDQEYDLQEETDNGTLNVSVNVKFKRDTIIIEQTLTQTTEFGTVGSANLYRIVLNRVGS